MPTLPDRAPHTWTPPRGWRPATASGALVSTSNRATMRSRKTASQRSQSTGSSNQSTLLTILGLVRAIHPRPAASALDMAWRVLTIAALRGARTWRHRASSAGARRRNTVAVCALDRMARTRHPRRLEVPHQEVHMTTATKKAPARKPVAKSSVDYLQQALEHLALARGQAQHEVRAGIDAAAERIREARKELRARAHEQADDLQARFDHASEARWASSAARRSAHMARLRRSPNADLDPRAQAHAARLIRGRRYGGTTRPPSDGAAASAPPSVRAMAGRASFRRPWPCARRPSIRALTPAPRSPARRRADRAAARRRGCSVLDSRELPRRRRRRSARGGRARPRTPVEHERLASEARGVSRVRSPAKYAG